MIPDQGMNIDVRQDMIGAGVAANVANACLGAAAVFAEYCGKEPLADCAATLMN